MPADPPEEMPGWHPIEILPDAVVVGDVWPSKVKAVAAHEGPHARVKHRRGANVIDQKSSPQGAGLPEQQASDRALGAQSP